MTKKSGKNKNQTQNKEARRVRTLQMIFLALSAMLILSMILSAFITR